jgi:c-di-GMP-binding flagellar brake protein YcgR
MSEQEKPHEDQQITLVSVRDGDISVSSATVVPGPDRMVTVEVDKSSQDSLSLEIDQPVTLLYSSDERVMRLKASVSEIQSPSQIIFTPLENAKEGDRRDYRRADVDAKVFCEPLDGEDVGVARAAQAARQVRDEEYGEQSINLSGSGITIDAPEPLAANTLLDLRLGLPLLPDGPIQVIGRVVRAFDEVAGVRLAVRFAEISEADQDKVVYAVFSRCFE